MPITGWMGPNPDNPNSLRVWTRESVVEAIAEKRSTTPVGRLDFHGADWRDLDLTGLDLSSLNLGGAGLGGVDASGALFRDTELFGASLPASLVGADLTHADLCKCMGDGTDFTDASLVNARLTRGDFYEATFVRADLSEAFLTDAFVHGCDMTGARLDGAEVSWSLNECIVDEATAVGARGDLLPDTHVTVGGRSIPAVDWFASQTPHVRLQGQAPPDTTDLDRWMREFYPD